MKRQRQTYFLPMNCAATICTSALNWCILYFILFHNTPFRKKGTGELLQLSGTRLPWEVLLQGVGREAPTDCHTSDSGKTVWLPPGRQPVDQIFPLTVMLGESFGSLTPQSLCVLWTRRRLSVRGSGVYFKSYLVPVDPKQELCPHPRHKVKLVHSGGWTPSGLALVSDPVCVVHGQDLKVQSWTGRGSGLGTAVSHLCFMQTMWFCRRLQAETFGVRYGRFTAEREAAGMRVSSWKSEVMVLGGKQVECTLQVRVGETLPQREEFRYLVVLFLTDDGVEREMDRQIKALLSVMRVLLCLVVATSSSDVFLQRYSQRVLHMTLSSAIKISDIVHKTYVGMVWTM